MALFRRKSVDPLDRLEIAPPGAYRRGIFVMLLVLGLFSAAGYFSAAEARRDAREARERADLARGERTLLIRRVDQLLAGQEEAEQERQRAVRRNAALERIIVALLSDSDDPEVAKAFEEFNRFGDKADVAQDKPTGPMRGQEPSQPRRGQPRQEQRPSPAPSPSSPAPYSSPSPLACVMLQGMQVCTP